MELLYFKLRVYSIEQKSKSIYACVCIIFLVMELYDIICDGTIMKHEISSFLVRIEYTLKKRKLLHKVFIDMTIILYSILMND